jgi:hypothetical protein
MLRILFARTLLGSHVRVQHPTINNCINNNIVFQHNGADSTFYRVLFIT